MPRSSLAEVHREFVHHTVEDEADGQKERQDDRTEDRQQGEESGEVEENQTNNMSAWKWRMRCEMRTPNIRLEPRVCVSNQRESVTCEVCSSQFLKIVVTKVIENKSA